MNQEKTILIISVAFGVTLIAFGFLVRYYRNEIQRLIEHSKLLDKVWKDCAKNWNISIEEMVLRGNKILELINSINILKNQNIRYSKICRRLYEENQNLKVEYQYLQEKIAELEKGKLKEKRGKR